MNIININDLSHSYVFAQKEIKTLKNISLYINKGEYISIVGKNGCGKSTLVKHLNALIDIQHGEITIATLDCKNNKNIYKIRQKCGMVFQNPNNQFVSSVVKEDIEFSLKNYNIDYDDSTISKALSIVGLENFENRDIYSLSGGQKQRLELAGILWLKNYIIIIDEAKTMLSPNSRKSVLNTLNELHKKTDITIIAITQYSQETVDCDRIVVMKNGEVLAQGSPEKIYSNSSLIERAEIGVPYCVKIYYDLKDNGIELSKCPLNNESLVELLCRLK